MLLAQAVAGRRPRSGVGPEKPPSRHGRGLARGQDEDSTNGRHVKEQIDKPSWGRMHSRLDMLLREVRAILSDKIALTSNVDLYQGWYLIKDQLFNVNPSASFLNRTSAVGNEMHNLLDKEMVGCDLGVP